MKEPKDPMKRTMTVRGISEETADRFVGACKANGRKVGEVLAELMEDYSAKTWKKLSKESEG